MDHGLDSGYGLGVWSGPHILKHGSAFFMLEGFRTTRFEASQLDRAWKSFGACFGYAPDPWTIYYGSSVEPEYGSMNPPGLGPYIKTKIRGPII